MSQSIKSINLKFLLKLAKLMRIRPFVVRSFYQQIEKKCMACGCFWPANKGLSTMSKSVFYCFLTDSDSAPAETDVAEDGQETEEASNRSKSCYLLKTKFSTNSE